MRRSPFGPSRGGDARHAAGDPQGGTIARGVGGSCSRGERRAPRPPGESLTRHPPASRQLFQSLAPSLVSLRARSAPRAPCRRWTDDHTVAAARADGTVAERISAGRQSPARRLAGPLEHLRAPERVAPPPHPPRARDARRSRRAARAAPLARSRRPVSAMIGDLDERMREAVTGIEGDGAVSIASTNAAPWRGL